MKQTKRIKSTTQVIMLGFLAVILLGSIVLSLPVCSSGDKISYLDALFTATTSVCVTGLVTLPTVSTWSTFGQIVILILIQIGGLGVITVFSGFMISARKKFGIGYRMLIQDSFNLNSLHGLRGFVKKVIIASFAIEAAGALSYMTVFVPRFGARGIWVSLFTSVSAFCNAGIDIIAENSLCDYALSPVINLTTILLIVLGGIGYIVWLDLSMADAGVFKNGKSAFRNLTVHTKTALAATAVLIFGGALLFMIFEYNNPLTIGKFGLFDKIQFSFFQSVTTRTAGFATVPQENLTNASSFVSMVLMFIGGSPVGTAGGIKTVTVAVIFASVLSAVKQKDEVSIFGRAIPPQVVKKAIAVAVTSFSIAFISTALLSAVTGGNALDTAYESVSACATVGLSKNYTATLNAAGKAIIIATMYLGRVGPISLAVAFNQKRENQLKIKNPTGEFIVG